MLYGIMIYRMTSSYEDQAIILADSGMMQSTAEKKHLLLTFYNGVWNENMRSSDVAGTADVPYRRETFATKRILLDFDGDFSLADINDISSDARAKGLGKILHDLDSIKEFNDSVGRATYLESTQYFFRLPDLSKQLSAKAIQEAGEKSNNLDSIFNRLSLAKKQSALRNAMGTAQSTISDLDMKATYAKALHRRTRTHQIQAIKKFTLSFTCLIFFFIGAPLGAIIRKGGLGVPVIVSVLVFIIYYILDSTGEKMARDDQWTVWYGMLISTVVLTPLSAFFTYKANNDSVVFNIDLYKQILMRVLGLRTKRHIYRKEVIIEDPKYQHDAEQLEDITLKIKQYQEHHKLLRWPNPIKVFFHAGDDQEIEHINETLEETIEDLGYSRDKIILAELNNYPIMATHAHTRPFRQKWLNIITGLVLPVGLFFYFRMLRFRFRLFKDLRHIRLTNERIIPKALELAQKQNY
jgi:lipopolysaccharide export system permease protein